MSSFRFEKLRWPLLAAIAFGVASCGGRASGEPRDAAQGGASGASSSSGTAGAGAPETNEPEPSTVHVIWSDGDIDAQATPGCLAGFQGFSARLGEMRVDFQAFVYEPGDYTGDPVKILWLEAVLANGEYYRAAVGTLGSGTISLHVAQVEPRFIGSLEASLPALNDPMLAPLTLRISFDIAVRAGCP
ncbi:MAG: hypothetical protein ABJB12_16330 [Pseudomonadota bacterium]